MVELPISLGWKPSKPIRLDLLPSLEGEVAVHVHLSEGKDKAHLKLEYGDTPYCLSLFVFDLKAFLENRKVRVRSYDLWPKKIMFAARLPNGTLHPRSNGWVYREDAVIIAWGSYRLNPPKIEFYLDNLDKKLVYKIVYTGTRKYFSPKYGYSVRTEYYFLPYNK